MMRDTKQVRVDAKFDELSKMLYPRIKSSRIRSILLSEKIEEMLYGKKK